MLGLFPEVREKESNGYGRGRGRWCQRNNDKTYYGHDILGSVILQTNERGHRLEEFEYDAFGQLIGGNFHKTNDFGYNGKLYDNATEQYNYGFRDYAPNLGRWTTVYPIRDGDNWYGS